MAEGNTALVRAPINAGGQVAAIVAHNFDDAYRIANALAKSEMTPQGIDTPEKCLAVILAGAEIGMPPFQALQSFALINGRPALWGDGMLGVVRRYGVRVEEWSTGTIDGGDFVAHCKVTRPDTGEVIERTFSQADARRAGLLQTEARVRRKNFKTGEWYEKENDSPWFKYPQRMIPMRARSWALRDGCADMLRGMKMAEEMQDVAEAVEARVIDRTDDQRPAEERDPRINPKYGVIGGQAGKDVFDEIAQRMSEASAEDELDAIWSDAAKTPLSANRKDALVEYCETVRQALRDETPIPAPPRFAKEKEEAPSPFAALKTEGEAVAGAEALAAFTAKLTKEALGKCTADERNELKAIHAAAKARAAKPNEGAPAPAPSSLSPAEVKKLEKEIQRMIGECQTLKELDTLPGFFADDLKRAPESVREEAETRFAVARAKFGAMK